MKKWYSFGLALCLTGVVWSQPPTPSPPLLRGPDSQRLGQGPVRMNYENLDIRVLAKLVSELCGRNIVVDDRVQGKVTLLSSREMSPSEVYELFRLALDRYGFVIKSKGNFEVITPVADARKAAPLVKRPGGAGNQPILGLILLQRADVTQLQNALKPLASDPNLVQAYPNARALIVIDRPAVVSRVAELARQMDKSTPDTKVEVVALTYAESEKLAPVLQQVLTRNQVIQGDPAPPKVAAFVPANSIVIQGSPEQIATARKMVKRLDLKRAAPDQIEKPQFFVHFLQYAKAEETAKVLTNLLSEGEQAQRRQQSLDQANLNLVNPQAPSGGATPAPRLPGSFLGPGEGENSGDKQRIAFISSKVASDVETNSLVLFMSPSEYQKVEELLGEIDIPRKQVLVLGMIAEVSLSKLMQTGAQLQIANANGLLSSFRGGLTEEGLLSSLASGNFVVGGLGGETRNINVGGRDVRVPTFFALLNGLGTNTDFNLISSPRILTSDHKEGIVEVGDVVPFPTGTTFDAFGQPLVTYDFRPVGIKMTFTPHISQSDTLRLDLEQEVQEVTDFLRQDLGGSGFVVPLISNRSVKTQVTMREGETLLIGGLISKRTLDVINKVPILGDIPIIDNFFKETSKEHRKTTLFIALTPYIIQHPDEVARLDRPYEQFIKDGGTPRDSQHEDRPTARRHAVQEPYGQPAASAPPEGTLVLEELLVSPPEANDTLRQARVRVRNRNPFEVEVVLHQQVREPNGQARDTRSEPQRLLPNEAREVVLPPYRFPARPGDYYFDVSAWVGQQQVGRLPLPRKVQLK